MFGRIVRRYDLMNRIMTLGRDRSWRRATVDALLPTADAPALDVGCGTGDLTLALARTGAMAIGLDPVPAMLDAAALKLDAADVPLRLVEGDGLALPFADGTFQCAASAFVMRNVADLPGALAETHRVLRHGGRAAVLELTPLSLPIVKHLFRLYFHRVVPIIGGLVTGDRGAYSYLPTSVDRFPDAHRLAEMMTEAGFRRVRYRRFMFGTVALHIGDR